MPANVNFWDTIKRVMRFSLHYPPLLINLGVGVVLLFCAYSPYISPVAHPYWACAGLLFPFFVLGNAMFVFYWLVVRRKFLIVPLFFFLLSWAPLRAYMPVNFGGKQTEQAGDTLRVLTYNTMNLFTEIREEGVSIFPSWEYVKNQDADIVCIQEFPLYLDKALEEVKKQYPYSHGHRLVGGNGLLFLSKYPILFYETIHYPSDSNGSVAFYIKYKKDTLLVVNNHLESNRINDHDKEAYSELLHKPSKSNIVEKGWSLLTKLAKASAVRSVQADSVASYVKRQHRPLTIVCGDLNDSPISYTRRRISQGLTDAFMTRGNGVGFTYNKSRMYFRIDHLFVGSGFQVVDCRIDKTIDTSDHYPMWTVLRIPQ